MKHTIKSRTLGKQIVFSVPGNYYIFVDLNGMPGILGKQLCKGGKLWGATLGYSGNDPAEFTSICKKWYNSYLKTI